LTAKRILVVEDDVAIRRGVARTLERAGFAVAEAGDGVSGERLARSGEVDLVLLDLALPLRDGLEVLDGIRRADPTVPVIVVTARGDEAQRVDGLRRGADDYVVKPFGTRELVARVEAVLRRSPERRRPVEILESAGREIDLVRQEVRFAGGERVELSALETELLRYLAERPRRTISRDELLHRVWRARPHAIATRSVDMTVARLRKKLGDGGEDGLLVTVRGKGYKVNL
jgi:DNA-binding response OmpR family regulator